MIANAQAELQNDSEWVTFLSERLHNGIVERVPAVVLNGDKDQRYNGNLNFSFAFVEGEFLHAIGPGLEPLHVPDEVQEFERTGLGEASDAPVLVGIAPSVVVLESEGGAASVDELGE